MTPIGDAATGGDAGHDDRVSVVIPVGDRTGDLLGLLEQVPDFADEVIVVDGGSLNGELGAARAIRPDLRVVLEPTPGARSAVQAGFAAASGNYVVMVEPGAGGDAAAIEQFVAALRAGSGVWRQTA